MSESCKLLLFLLPLFIFIYVYVCACLFIYVYHVPAGSRRGQLLDSLEQVVGGCSELNLCPLQEQHVFLTAGPLQLDFCFFNNVHI